jgi:hypothetical protein
VDAENSHADPDGPSVGTIVPEKGDRTFVLPKASISIPTVVVRKIEHPCLLLTWDLQKDP